MPEYMAVRKQHTLLEICRTPEIAAEVKYAMVPCLVVQPLVENAIRHGIAHCENEGLVEASARREGDFLHVMVRDTVPVVILTADDRPASRDRTLEFGAADYLLKQHSSPPKLKQSLRNAVLRFRETQKRDGSRYEA